MELEEQAESGGGPATMERSCSPMMPLMLFSTTVPSEEGALNPSASKRASDPNEERARKSSFAPQADTLARQGSPEDDPGGDKDGNRMRRSWAQCKKYK